MVIMPQTKRLEAVRLQTANCSATGRAISLRIDYAAHAIGTGEAAERQKRKCDCTSRANDSDFLPTLTSEKLPPSF